MKNSYYSLAVQGAGLIGMLTASCSGPEGSPQPNILLILADDMGYSDIGCYGSEIKTPVLDRLASQGMRMTRFYNASRSCPTRASLLPGLYQHQAGVGDMVNDLGYPSYQGYLNYECVTLAEALKANGYNTFMSGKWHVGSRPETHPLKRGFNRFFGLIEGAGSYFERIAYRPSMKRVTWMTDSTEFEPPDSGFYFTDAVADYALDFLKQDKESTKPFFMYLAFTAPHWPLHALPEDIEKYRGKYMNGWDRLREERYSRMIDMGIIESTVKLSSRDSMSKDWNTLADDEKTMWDLRMAVYAAMIDRMDQNIGRIVNYLTETGELENTLILFLSDNGGCHENTRNQSKFLNADGETGTRNSFDAYEYPWANASNTPFRMFKHWVHEGGISTPFIAYYPQIIKGGEISAQPAHIIDIMPTLIDLAGGKYPEKYNGREIKPMEGVSLLPAFRGKSLNRNNPLFWEHQGNRAVRDGDWKLVSAYDNGKKEFKAWELYNLHDDMSELNDLSKTYPEKKSEMIRLFDEWAERAGVIPKEKLDKK